MRTMRTIGYTNTQVGSRGVRIPTNRTLAIRNYNHEILFTLCAYRDRRICVYLDCCCVRIHCICYTITIKPMRTIKFRAWNKKIKYMYEKVLSFDMCDGPGEIVVGGKDIEDNRPILVKDVVLLQLTGLTDMNGKDIYEGDIVEVRDVGFGYKYVGVINWDQESLCYLLGIIKDYPSMPGGKRDIVRTLKYHSFEIVGNIYETPKLLQP